MKIKILANLSNSHIRNRVLDVSGISVCLCSAMGAGGGYIPLIVEYEHIPEDTASHEEGVH